VHDTENFIDLVNVVFRLALHDGGFQLLNQLRHLKDEHIQHGFSVKISHQPVTLFLFLIKLHNGVKNKYFYHGLFIFAIYGGFNIFICRRGVAE
jgi:hypothetical protein